LDLQDWAACCKEFMHAEHGDNAARIQCAYASSWIASLWKVLGPGSFDLARGLQGCGVLEMKWGAGPEKSKIRQVGMAGCQSGFLTAEQRRFPPGNQPYSKRFKAKEDRRFPA
jgi:hypothetical protein